MTLPDRHLPDFFVLGAQKAGTTSLHAWLQGDARVRLPREKETHFFSDDEKYARGIDWYVAQFPAWHPGAVTGEVAPQYMYEAQAAARIRAWIASPLLVFLLRHPLERAWSNYLMTVRQGHESLAFPQALAAEADRLRGGGRFERDHYGYMARGRYREQIERYRKVFPEARMLFVLFDDLVAGGDAGAGTRRRIAAAIGLDAALPDRPLEQENAASRPRSRLLRDLLYRPSVLRRPVRWLIPSRDLRERIAHRLDLMNQARAARTMPAIPAAIAVGADREIDALQALTGIDLESWRRRTRDMTKES